MKFYKDIKNGEIEVFWVPDGNHSLIPRKKSGIIQNENWSNGIKKMVKFMKENIKNIKNIKRKPIRKVVKKKKAVEQKKSLKKSA